MNSQANETKRKCMGWKGYVAVAVALFLTTAVFTYFYTKQYEEQLEIKNIALMEREAANKRLEAGINLRDSLILVSKARETELRDSLRKRKIEYVYIERKYDKKIDSVLSLPMDAKVSFLANWLSEADSLQWRHSSSSDTSPSRHTEHNQDKPR